MFQLASFYCKQVNYPEGPDTFWIYNKLSDPKGTEALSSGSDLRKGATCLSISVYVSINQ